MADYKPIPSLSLQQIEHFWDGVNVDMYDADACWLWTRHRNWKGYGRLRVKGIVLAAHRLAYFLRNGDPGPLTVDHLCGNPGCCNPAHLEAVTLTENTNRGHSFAGVNRRATHCPKGHEYSTANTRVRRGRRECLACIRTKRAEHKQWRSGKKAQCK